MESSLLLLKEKNDMEVKRKRTGKLLRALRRLPPGDGGILRSGDVPDHPHEWRGRDPGIPFEGASSARIYRESAGNLSRRKRSGKER